MTRRSISFFFFFFFSTPRYPSALHLVYICITSIDSRSSLVIYLIFPQAKGGGRERRLEVQR